MTDLFTLAFQRSFKGVALEVFAQIDALLPVGGSRTE